MKSTSINQEILSVARHLFERCQSPSLLSLIKWKPFWYPSMFALLMRGWWIGELETWWPNSGQIWVSVMRLAELAAAERDHEQWTTNTKWTYLWAADIASKSTCCRIISRNIERLTGTMWWHEPDGKEKKTWRVRHQFVLLFFFRSLFKSGIMEKRHLFWEYQSI